MNNLKTVSFLLLSSILIFSACNENKSKDTSTDSSINTPGTTTPSDVIATPPPANTIAPNQTMTAPAATEPAQNAEGVWHFTCTKGCTGGAGTAENCKTCGGLLEHNAAYHPQNPTTITPGQTPPTLNQTNQIPDQNISEPAKNAAGVWHFTCAKGCTGGAGTASACGTCGTTLAHNNAYHQ